MTNTEQHVTDNKKYKIVFTGQIQPGQDHLTVKARLASIFGLTGSQIEKLFPGKPVLVKGNLTYDDARLFKMKLEQGGAVCQLLEMSEKPSFQATKQEPVKVFPPAEQVAPVPVATGPKAVSLPMAGNGEFTFRKADAKSGPPKYLWVIGAVIILIVISSVIGRKPTQGRPISGNGSSASIENAEPKVFVDPKDYYSVSLPGNYTISNKSAGSRSKITFKYPGQNTVTIIASPMNRQWIPEQQMLTKVDSIRKGRAGPISSFTIVRYQLVYFNDLNGYEIVLRKGNQLAHSYAAVTSTNVAFSIAIVTSGRNSQADHDKLNDMITSTIEPR